MTGIIWSLSLISRLVSRRNYIHFFLTLLCLYLLRMCMWWVIRNPCRSLSPKSNLLPALLSHPNSYSNSWRYPFYNSNKLLGGRWWKRLGCPLHFIILLNLNPIIFHLKKILVKTFKKRNFLLFIFSNCLIKSVVQLT